MREGDRAPDLDLIAFPHTPHHTAEIAESVDRDDGSFLKGRCKKCAGHMRAMMFDEMHLLRLSRHNSLSSERLAYLCNPNRVGGAGCESRPPMRTHRQSKQFVH